MPQPEPDFQAIIKECQFQSVDANDQDILLGIAMADEPNAPPYVMLLVGTVILPNGNEQYIELKFRCGGDLDDYNYNPADPANHH